MADSSRHPRAEIREFLQRDEPATATARLLFVSLYCRADPKRGYTSWPSIATLAADIRSDRTTVIAATKQLEELGLIAVERDRGFDPKTRKRRVNVYTVPPLPRADVLADSPPKPKPKNPLRKDHR